MDYPEPHIEDFGQLSSIPADFEVAFEYAEVVQKFWALMIIGKVEIVTHILA